MAPSQAVVTDLCPSTDAGHSCQFSLATAGTNIRPHVHTHAQPVKKFKDMTPAKAFLTIGVAVVVAATGFYAWKSGASGDQPKYKTQEVDRANITRSISANGTLSPVVLVNVGTQVSGTVKRLHADFNDHVVSGQVLAELDPALFQAQLAQDEAGLQNALSALTLSAAKAERQAALFKKGFISVNDNDQALQTLVAAKAQVALARAQVERARTNLRYTIIRSPISGVVVARNVDLGQTVAASFQTPTLFQIAQDLKQMQIDTSVSEADVGDIHVGQSVRFTVDAFPDLDFRGNVKQIRLNPTIQQNVVTYNVVVGVNNDEGRLMPGMTAHVYIDVRQAQNVLRVPTAALRFKPKTDEEDQEKPSGKRAATKVYLLLPDGALKPVPVKVGINDSAFTEIIAGGLKEGDKVVTRELASNKGGDKSTFKLRAF
jgi:HlyD family secretion protein